MKIEELKKELKKDYKSESTIRAITGGNSKPNADLRYKYEKELNIPFNEWGDKIRNHIDEACKCCGTILRSEKIKKEME